MPTSIEAQGVTVEEAIQVALNHLGVTRDRVEIEIVHHPRSGFLGLGARRAKVRATVREAFLADGEEYDMASGEKIGRGSRRGRRSRRRKGRGGREETEARRPEPREQRGSRDAREAPPRERDQRSDSDRDRGRRGGRGRDGERSREGDRDRGRDAERGREGDRERGDRDREGRGGDSSRRRDGQRGSQQHDAGRGRGGTPPSARQEPPPQRPQRKEIESRASSDSMQEPRTDAPSPTTSFGHPAIGTSASSAPVAPAAPAQSREEAQQRATALTTELLQKMGFQANVSSHYDETEQEIVIKVESDAEGLLIGRRGQTLDAFEHVLNRMVLAGESAGELRLALDVGGYRDRRRETLLELAERLKVRAVTQGRRIQVSPMSPRDRRLLQSVLGRDDTVRTRVLGTGFYRRVVIFPVGLEEDSMPIEHDDTHGADLEPGAEEEGA
jgi:spoIIIJ-associated protein